MIGGPIIGIGAGVVTAGGLSQSVGSYDADTMALAARMSSQPTLPRLALINNLIVALKLAGVWSKLDLLYVLAAADDQAARLNWRGGGYDLVVNGAPVFTADRGYQGDGVAAYLNTGWNALVPGAAFVQNSAHISVGVNVNGTTLGAMGDGMSPGARVSITATQLQARLNDGVAGLSVAATGPARALVSRTNAAGYDAYRNGALVTNYAAVSSPVLNGPQTLLRTGTIYYEGRVSYASIGAGLTAPEVAAFDAALAAYLSAAGA